MHATLRILTIALFVSLTYGQAPPENTTDRVFTFAVTDKLPNRQEISTVIRGISDVRHVSADPEQRTFTVRGTPGQIRVAEWLFGKLDTLTPPQADVHSGNEFRPAAEDDIVRVFYLAHTDSPQALQEVATTVRSITEVRRLFTYNSQKALTLRGTAAQMALADWLFKNLDRQSSQAFTANEFRPSAADDVIRVFHLGQVDTPQRLQEITSQVRTMSQVPRAFIVNSQKAVAMRGTFAQIAVADQLIREQDK